MSFSNIFQLFAFAENLIVFAKAVWPVNADRSYTNQAATVPCLFRSPDADYQKR
jgi:hypothetical protein